jgi:hypothetical protein
VNDQEYISHLKSHIRSQDSLLGKQAEQLMMQAGNIEQLEKKVEQLLFMLQKQGVKKNSQNSHQAPSKDLFVAKNKSLR